MTRWHCELCTIPATLPCPNCDLTGEGHRALERILVCGGRFFADYDFVARSLYSLCPPAEMDTWMILSGIVIIQGGATGVDSLADQWAVTNWVCSETYEIKKEEWDQYGKMAGAVRNQRMLTEGKPDMVVAFIGGRGTRDMIDRAKAAGIPVMEFVK